jgi:lipid II:glycine glycyltransferase (peptidoglycan interpeptide bridge formation enzyme)
VSSSLAVRPITPDEHLALVTAMSGSFLQTPAWGAIKQDWTHESLGWFDGDRLAGAGLVLYRSIPRMKRTLAYLPEGPVIDWGRYDCNAITAPLLAHLRARRSFSVKMGPPVEARRWHAKTVKDAIAAGRAKKLAQVPADSTSQAASTLVDELRTAGWTRRESEAGFGDFQPRYVFQVPLGDRSLDEVFSGFNQLWRRNVRKAEKAGVKVTVGSDSDLGEFHRIYVETAQRDHFTPRPLSYFQQMFGQMQREDAARIRLYLAHHDGRLLAATTAVTVGKHTWYSYGASTNEGRELRPSNAIQWQMIQDAHAGGSAVYDMRGITDTLDPDDHLFGLIQFKVGTGGDAIEYVGEWDYPINNFLHRAFTYYMGRR